MQLIPAGEFIMGSAETESERSSDEGPLRKISIPRPFYMATFEVTQLQWEKIMNSNVIQQRDNDRPQDKGKPLYGVSPRHPMYYISWLEAVRFCNELSKKEDLTPAYCFEAEEVIWNSIADGYRLPTEAEWEYAARAGSTTRFFWGESVDSSYAWQETNSDKKSWPVGSKKPNAFGLYDTIGNIWEWCWDRYGDYDSSIKSQSQGPSTGSDRIIRGGGWDSPWKTCRSAFRDSLSPDTRWHSQGFRIAKNAQ